MESKVTTREKIISCFKDGQTIAIGGQTGHWMPERLIDCILESGARHLTVYSIDTSDPGVGIGRLIRAKVIDRIITTHVGTNPDTNAQIQAGTLQAEFSPIGNLAYRGSTGRASHPIVATCGDLSIVECDHFCDLGEITPDEVEVPGMFVDMILV